MSRLAPVAPAPAGAYPERRERRPSALDRFGAQLAAPILRRRHTSWRRLAGFPALVETAGRDLAGASDADLRARAAMMRGELRAGFGDAVVARAFALVREAASRTIGQRHFDVQLIGGRVLLDGMIAEMETGEGKTLTATLAASTAALAGIPVHVVTVNDYLAARDADWMGKVYAALGLTVGVVTHGMDPRARRAAYGADITYVTNKELAFDYLRDRLVLGQRAGRIELQLERLVGDEARARRLVLRGLHYAIVDEADSVLVDEARTPLIISGGGHGQESERRLYVTAMTLADQLRPEIDFVVDSRGREVRVTDEGAMRLEELTGPLGGIWRGRMRREELVRQALTARHLFHRDQHYLVSDGKVQIVDEFTGRVMADRSWEHGLHQFIEVKEGVAVTAPHQALARMSYQRFFRRYLRLAGMTGTAREVRGELWSVYRLAVVSIPTNRPLRRRALRGRTFVTAEDRWEAVVERVTEIHETGRPVLLGTRSVAASEHLSRLLEKAGLPHRVLNARQDAEEAEIIAEAGGPGRITVATNMAGRGTDIRLEPGVAELGGLHVLATERHEARRIDRQLFGRAGRQGDPGSYEAIVSLEDELALHAPRWSRLAARMAGPDGSVPGWIARRALRRAQRAAERTHARMRADLLALDEQLESALAFSGQLE